jgi:transposase InsO family protein
MKEHNLLVTRQYKNKAKRTFSRPKPRADRPNQVWGTDMTKINIGSWGWMYLVIIIDWHTKEIIGHCLSMQSKTDQWLEALHEAVDKRFPHGIRDTMEEQLHLVSDNGCQPSSQRYIKECGVLGINQIFTSWSNPRGNADTERVLRTLKEDLVWCHDWDNPFDFQAALKDWINRYNRDFPHQTLNYMTPEQFYQKNVERGTRGPQKAQSVSRSLHRSLLLSYFHLDSWGALHPIHSVHFQHIPAEKPLPHLTPSVRIDPITEE